MPNEPARVKASKRPRYRYVLVRFHDLPPGFSRQDAIDALRNVEVESEAPWLTRFNGEFGILRIARGREKALVKRLREPLVSAKTGTLLRLEPLLTSGSIAGLHRRHGAPAIPR